MAEAEAARHKKAALSAQCHADSQALSLHRKLDNAKLKLRKVSRAV